MSDSLHETALDLQTEGEPYALVTVTDTVNSSPRKIGSKMLVREDGSIEGSVGGGAMEAFVIEQAKQAIEENESQKVSHRLEPNELNMYCGGKVEFFIGVERRSFHLLQFGAGHVGEAIARVGDAIGRSYTIVDDREEFADPDKFPGASKVLHVDFDDWADHVTIDENTYVSIITRCHDTDIQIMEQVLDSDAAYIGMIGSDTKCIRLFRNLEERAGVNPADDDRVYAPIGLRLGTSKPGDIAISVWSEILKLHTDGTADHYRLDEEGKQRARARDDKPIGDEVREEPVDVTSDGSG